MSYLERKRKDIAEKESAEGITHPTAQGYDALEWNATTDPLQIIDTTLLRCYEKLNAKALITNLVTLPNHCHTKESENILLQARV